MTDWAGDNPYYLMSARYDHIPIFSTVDLDEPGWLSRIGDMFRAPGELYLVRKRDEHVVLSVRLSEGDQGYYVARHVGTASAVGLDKNEVTAYGIGKKRVNGNEDNLWVLPWGQVCGGNDVEYFAMQGLKKGLPGV